MRPKKGIALPLILIVMATLPGCGGGSNGALPESQQAGSGPVGTFAPAGNMTTARAGHTATLLLDGRVLIAGGGPAEIGSVPSGQSAELYDPTSGTFAVTGSLITPRGYHTATLLPSGQVLIVGGSNDTSAELYDPSKGTFSLTGSMLAQQRWLTATWLTSGHVLVAGDASAELYDPVIGAFRDAGPYAVAERIYATATSLADGRVLLVGDEPPQIYDPTNEHFSITGSLTAVGIFGLELYSATLLRNGKVLIAGGTNDEFPGGRVDQAELYDPATGTFSATGELLAARDAHTAVLLWDGRVLIVGGEGTSDGGFFSGSLSSAELYDPATGSFIPAGNMSIARSGPQATLLKNGDVLITGGVRYCGIDCFLGSTATAELYRPGR